MYLGFYGLREKPFGTTPDPRFLHLTPGHQEALAQLVYGIQESKGFMVLTGEVGTGKTTLVRTLLERFDGRIATAFVFNSSLPFDAILKYVLEDFGLVSPWGSRAERLSTLNRFLLDRHRAGQSALLILDEAQNLKTSTLEDIRLLSNFETSTDKLLQILLVGQPELAAKLRLPELRQLSQRVELWCTVPSLTPDQTGDYLLSRLRVAGARDVRLFSERAVRRIAQHAKGIPRLVNILADHCLLIGYADQTRRIDRGAVEQAIAYLKQAERRERGPAGIRSWLRVPRLGWLLGVLAVAVLTGLGTLGASAGRLDEVSGRVAAHINAVAESLRTLVTP